MNNEESIKSTTSLGKNRQRSTAYPAFSLEEAVEATRKLKEQLGKGPYSRIAAAEALGYKGVTGSSGTKISACVQFGLLEKAGSTYFQSQLAERILTPTNEMEKGLALLESVESPTLYARLISEFEGQPLPAMLENILVRKHGLIENSSRNAADNFRSSLEYVGRLKNGVLLSKDITTQSQQVDASSQSLVKPLAGESLDAGDEATSSRGSGIVVEIPGTDVKVIFPENCAFDLSIGSFSDGIKALKKNVQEVLPESQGDRSIDEGLDNEV